MKRFFLLSILTACQYLASAQDLQSIRKDSLYIDSLQRILPLKKDTSRINCLNNIADGFLNRDGWKIKVMADSAYPYAIAAKKEAQLLNYQHGIAYSLIHLNNIYFFYVIDNNNKSKDNSLAYKNWETYLADLFALASKVNDNTIWGFSFYWEASLKGKRSDNKGFIESNKKALEYFKRAGDEFRESEISTWLCMQYSDNGEYEKGFSYCKRSLELAKKFVADPKANGFPEYMMQQALMNMSDLYVAAGDYETAMDYLRQSESFHLSRKSSMTWSVEGSMSELFRKMGVRDSAAYYYKPLPNNNPKNWAALRLAEKFYSDGNYDSSLLMFKIAIEGFRKIKNASPRMLKNSLTGAARSYLQKNNYKAALPLAKESLAMAEKGGDLIGIRDNLEILAEVYFYTGKPSEAYLHLKKYNTIKDSLLSRQFLWRLNNYKKEAQEQQRSTQLQLLKKDNQLSRARLKQETTLRNNLAVGLILILLISVFTVRALHFKRKAERLRALQLENELTLKELESKQKQSQLQHKATKLEMEALRAQMNPHFIFNCLSSINRFVLKNETEAASDYLTRFSRLIRMVLINSQKSSITLEDEMEMLRLYLDMERLRFKHSFDYNIIFSNTVDAGNIFVPPLLLQPFCENAVWHGLMHKEGQGRLDITIRMEENVLHCTISDNGIGRIKAAELKSKSGEKGKSLGLKITTDRLALLNENCDVQTFYSMHDLLDENGEVAGTVVNLEIKYKEEIKELV